MFGTRVRDPIRRSHFSIVKIGTADPVAKSESCVAKSINGFTADYSCSLQPKPSGGETEPKQVKLRGLRRICPWAIMHPDKRSDMIRARPECD